MVAQVAIGCQSQGYRGLIYSKTDMEFNGPPSDLPELHLPLMKAHFERLYGAVLVYNEDEFVLEHGDCAWREQHKRSVASLCCDSVHLHHSHLTLSF